MKEPAIWRAEQIMSELPVLHRKTTKGVSKSVVKTFNKNLCKGLGSKIVHKSSFAVEKAGLKVASKTKNGVTDQIIKQGVTKATREGAAALTQKTARGLAEKMVYNAVKSPTTHVIKKHGVGEMKLVLKQMVSTGQCSAKEAKLLHKAYLAAFKGKNNALLGEIQNGLEASVKKPLLEVFNRGVEKGIKETAPSVKARLVKAGASAAHANKLLAGMKEGTRKGAREGFEIGLKKAIKDGVNAAVKKPQMIPTSASFQASSTTLSEGFRHIKVAPREETPLEFEDIRTTENWEELNRRSKYYEDIEELFQNRRAESRSMQHFRVSSVENEQVKPRAWGDVIRKKGAA